MITHHDSDHISRLTHVLEGETVGVQHIYHNGLATFAPGARGSPSAGLPTGLGVYCGRASGSGRRRAGSGRQVAVHLPYMAESPKIRRIEFRTTEQTRSLIDRAAHAANVSLTDFAERCLRREAERVLADRTSFVLSDSARAEWDVLNERPARELPGVQQLMRRPSPFKS